MADTTQQTAASRGLAMTDDPALSEALIRAYPDARVLTAPSRREARRARTQTLCRDKGLAERTDFVEPASSDPTGFERIIGESDLTSINYLDRGRRAAEAVCRIRVPSEGGEWFGTGFLVGPRLLMTNHHVLGSRDEASQAEAEFGYEHDLDGVLKPSVGFNLRPHELFFSEPELDVTFVSVSPLSDGGVPLERHGWLPLLPMPGKVLDGEWVTIIQHPQGGPKQIAIRSNRIVRLPRAAVKGVNVDHFIHYLTDTEPGSSGAPVLNDQWQVVALHHKAVPLPSKPKSTAPVVFIGNEGVRISALYSMLEERRFEDDDAAGVLQRLEGALGLTPTAGFAGDVGEGESTRPFPATRWGKKTGIGYDPKFLSETISFDSIYKPRVKAAAPLLGGKGHELRYNHFSVVIDEKRKFAMLTAVNILGGKVKNLARSDVWRTDPRIADEYQPDADLYSRTRGHDKITFSRGHLVRRLDPCWGTDAAALAGEQDSFHFTNATPQVQTYNDVDWGNLEDYVLARALTTERRMSVFTGPIFRKNDPFYGRDRKGGPWRIPLSFWKIAVLQKTDTQIAAAAFIVGQTQYVSALYEAKVFAGLKPYKLDDLRSRHIQTTIATVEQETGLSFAAIRKFDAHGSLEATRRTRWINGPDDILI